MKLLVTGGAGYIGSHVVRHLREAGHAVTVYDNLSTGHAWAVGDAELVVADLADSESLWRVLARGFEGVLHFAAHIVVPESVAEPLKYYDNNTRNTLNLLRGCADTGVGYFVFSSTAAVYGIPDTSAVAEDAPLQPINPYGASKMMSERMLMDLGAASRLRYVSLRYFNVAGADPRGRLGQATPDATHLIKVACQAATAQRDGITVFGTDYDTRDGTCERDYIHVEDLAAAHVRALEFLQHGGDSQVLNCGYGHGYSVLEVLDAVKRASGVDFAVTFGGRREGDPPALLANAERIRGTLVWQPQYANLDLIVRHALAWEEKVAAFPATAHPGAHRRFERKHAH
ncbi:UDP-glucose 4-epimerase GalE [Thioalkalivibrio sp. AKL17]|uniref:UDP-glucose 4-epimerase GalE n=1 Tax=Thioalkalivibrio sp. AKL17 TaxID=1158160 RepID=UPI000382DC2A|nr:UDP-glucose 4-epimerase GalE [Thioalkalivibrio sp. AKL17]